MLTILHAICVVLILFGAGMVLAAIDDGPLESGERKAESGETTKPQMNGDER